MNPSTERWIAEFFESIDRMDADGFAAYFAADGGFRFANQPPLIGTAAIAGGAGGIFGMLDAIRHELIKHWSADGDLLVEGVVHYHRASDSRHFTFPFLSVFEFEDTAPGPIRSYRVFVDSHELFLPPSA
jgi:ketosteroid isomerase-like protein